MRLTTKQIGLVSLGILFCFSLAGCGNTTGSTSGNNKKDNNDSLAENVGDAAKDIADGAGDVVEDVANGAGNAVEDVANGAGNAVEDIGNGVGTAMDDLLGENGFTNYNDAHDYFLDTMHSYHADAKFEIRDEDRELNDYQEGSKGYRFKLYDTSKNDNGDLFGEFYVDANSGQIFQKDNAGNVTEYPGKDNAAKENAANRKTTTIKRKTNATTDTGMNK